LKSEWREEGGAERGGRQKGWSSSTEALGVPVAVEVKDASRPTEMGLANGNKSKQLNVRQKDKGHLEVVRGGKRCKLQMQEGEGWAVAHCRALA
jgi:hypothetical protein